MASSIRFGAAGALGLLAASELAWALFTAPLLGLLSVDGPSPVPVAPAIRVGAASAVFGGLSVAVAGLTALSAAGVATGSRWGWWAGIAGAILWLPTGCAPGALLALAILVLVPEVREIGLPPADA